MSRRLLEAVSSSNLLLLAIISTFTGEDGVVNGNGATSGARFHLTQFIADRRVDLHWEIVVNGAAVLSTDTRPLITMAAKGKAITFYRCNFFFLKFVSIEASHGISTKLGQ